MSGFMAYTPVAGSEWLKLRRAEAQRRREALEHGGCATYALGVPGMAERIVCLCCGLPSSNPTDIAERYCGFCSEYHSEGDSLDLSALERLRVAQRQGS